MASAASLASRDAALERWLSEAFRQQQEKLDHGLDAVQQRLEAHACAQQQTLGSGLGRLCQLIEARAEQPSMPPAKVAVECAPAKQAGATGAEASKTLLRPDSALQMATAAAPAAEVVGPRRSQPGNDVSRVIRRRSVTAEVVSSLESISKRPSLGLPVRALHRHRTLQEDGAWLKHLASDWFARSMRHGGLMDIVVGIVTSANIGVILVESEYQGHLTGVDLGLETRAGWDNAESFFEGLAVAFAAFYFLELFLRVLYFKCKFFEDKLHVLDAVVVLITFFDTILFVANAVSTDRVLGGLIIARFVRMGKVAFILVRSAEASPLRVLFRTIAISMRTVLSTALVLGMFMMLGALVLSESLNGFIRDVGEIEEDRLWMYERYGSAFKALWTMFEITLSGGWPTWVTPVVKKVSVWYAPFFVFYVVFVTFAVTRIISAIFLKSTLQIADSERDTVTAQKIREKATTARKLWSVFHEADVSGDGHISFTEFHRLVTDPKASSYLAALDIELYEVDSIFNLLDDGDGQISWNEFLDGIMRLKGSARTTDVLMVLHESRLLRHQLYDLMDSVSELAESHAGLWKLTVRQEAAPPSNGLGVGLPLPVHLDHSRL